MTNHSSSMQNGFQMMLAQRSAMQNWTHVRTILQHGSNREAAAIVDSFQRQIDLEDSEKTLKAA